MNMDEDEVIKEDFLNDEHVYESARGFSNFEEASMTDTITDSMVEYCDEEKLVDWSDKQNYNFIVSFI